MDGIKNAQDLINPWWTYFNYCFSDNPISATCAPFWERIIFGVIALGVIAVLCGVFKYFSYRRKLAAAIRAQEERDAIDEEAIRDQIWNGDKAFQAELAGEEIERRVRAGIEQRRRDARSPPQVNA
jgi:hypothetical protein